MLQDLDKRGSADGSGPGSITGPNTSQVYIRAVPIAANKSRKGWWIALILVALAVAFGAVMGRYFWNQTKPAPTNVKPMIQGSASRPPLRSNELTLAVKTPPVTIPALPAAPAPPPTPSTPSIFSDKTATTSVANFGVETNSIKPLDTSGNHTAPLSTLGKLAFATTVNVGKNPASDILRDATGDSSQGLSKELPHNILSNENASTSPKPKTDSSPTANGIKNSERVSRKVRESERPSEKTSEKNQIPPPYTESAGKGASQAKEITPQQAIDNNYRKAVALIDAGQLSQAISVLEQVLQVDPKHAAARQTLVGLLIDGKRQDDAMRRLQEGLALDPSLSGMAMILARLQVEHGNIRIAQQTLEHALPYALNDAEFQAFLAALLQREKRHKEAIEHYAIALKMVPENGLWWMGLGISLQSENRLPEARDAFTRAKDSSSLSDVLRTFVDQKLSQLTH